MEQLRKQHFKEILEGNYQDELLDLLWRYYKKYKNSGFTTSDKIVFGQELFKIFDNVQALENERFEF